ncbi:MAG TPA: PIN domain-containing protein, partial [Thermoplasmata archaeon]|nr:PIN domain-containing protein [Thermoplasmata archaeon]
MKIVPDTSVLIDGRVTRLLKEGRWDDVDVLIPEAVVAELEAQAHRGMETGYDGLEEIRALASKPVKRMRMRFAGARPTYDQVRL